MSWWLEMTHGVGASLGREGMQSTLNECILTLVGQSIFQNMEWLMWPAAAEVVESWTSR